MRTDELAALVPGIMEAHPLIDWRVSAEAEKEHLVIDLRSAADASRGAQIRVGPGCEVFTIRFAGHESADFAYGGDSDQVEVLSDRLEMASAALVGPTRVTVFMAGGVTVRSEMVIDPDGARPRADTVTTWPLRRLRSRLLLRRVTEERFIFDGPPPA